MRTDGPRDSAEALTPLEEFIVDQRKLLQGEPNSWEPVKSHLKLLLDAARGRKLRIQKIGSTQTLSRSGVQVGGLLDGISTLVSYQAMRITSSHRMTRQCLALSQVPFMPAKTLHMSQLRSAHAFRARIQGPVCIRPAAVHGQVGSAVGLRTPEQLSQAWDYASEAISGLPTIKQQIEVESFLPWVPLRLFLVAEEVVAAVARLPLYAVGDGERTLDQLAQAEVERRNACDHLEPVQDIDLRDLLDALLVDGQRVLSPGEVRLLTNDRRGQLGAGWSADVTDKIGSELTELAVNAMWAVPGLGASAVDILTPSLNPEGRAVVYGLAPEADLREFRYPTYGSSQAPNRSIMMRIAAAGAS